MRLSARTVPPDILDYPTSTDMVIREGSNVTLKCAATGSPTPTITWRREGGELIPLPSGAEGKYERERECMKVRVGDYKYVCVCVWRCVVCCLHDKWTRSVGDGCVQCGCGKFPPLPCKLFATMSKSNNAPHIAACLSSIKFAESALKFFKFSL